jgi:hypothetical protein
MKYPNPEGNSEHKMQWETKDQAGEGKEKLEN